MKKIILSILLILVLSTSNILAQVLVREIKIEAAGGVTIFPLLGFLSVNTHNIGNKTIHICKYPGLTSSDIEYSGIPKLEDFDKMIGIDSLINKIKQDIRIGILFSSDSKIVEANDNKYRIEYQYSGKNYRNFELEIKVYE